MLPTYSLKDIAINSVKPQSYHLERFEDMTDPDGIIMPHAHDFYSIVWFTSGTGWNVIDFFEHEIKANRLFFSIPGCVHNWSYSKNAVGYVLVFTPLAVPSCFGFENPFIDLNETDVGFLKSIFDYLISEYKTNDSYSERNIISGIQFMINSLERIFSRKQSRVLNTSNIQIKKLFQAIGNRTSPQNQVSYCADELKISERDLNELCQQHFNKSAKQFITEQNLTEAKRLLLYSSLRVNEIAYMLGFEDNSYFIRLFKKKNGITPTQFRAKFI